MRDLQVDMLINPKSIRTEPRPALSFPTTQWELLAVAAGEDSIAARDALASLCERYHGVIQSWIKRKGPQSLDSEDLTQEFIAFALEKNPFRSYLRERGPFRAFLTTCLQHFVRTRWSACHALRRGGGAVHLSALDLEVSSGGSGVDETLDRALAHEIDRMVMGALRQRAEAAGELRAFDALCSSIRGELGYGELGPAGKAAGLTIDQAKKYVKRLRNDYLSAFRSELHLVARGADLANELRYLLRLVAAEPR